ncbi:MAG TPA: ribonuclease III domain-containing protein, partial [Gammaproteobacteria bacterium]|nr:ribonuclease III domain-containing protein [Gammaproteobacteria bacterium]
MRNLRSLENLLGYTFKDVTLLQCALKHRSLGKPNNERLEFLGDSLLNFIIANRLFEEFPTATEGELTRFRATLVNRQSLAEIASTLDLPNRIELGIGEKKSGGFKRESILADALEAIFAAIYLDATELQPLIRVIDILYKN